MDDADAVGDGTPVGAVGLAEGVAHGQHHIGLAVNLQRRPRCVAAAGIDAAAQGQGVVFGEDALAHNGGGHGHRQEFGQFQHLIGGAGAHGPAAGVEDGQPGVDQQVGGALDFGIGGAGFARSAYGGVGQGGVIGLGGQHILGHFQHYRAGGAGAEGRESAPHYLGDVLHTGESAAPLAQAVKDAGRDFLLPFLAQVAEGVLAHQQQDGDVVGVAAGDGGEAVGGARAGAGHGDAHLAGGAGVAVGNLHAQPLVAGREGADGVGLAQGSPERRQAAAGESGYVTHTFQFQGFDDGFGATHNGSSLSF